MSAQFIFKSTLIITIIVQIEKKTSRRALSNDLKTAFQEQEYLTQIRGGLCPHPRTPFPRQD